MLQTYFIIGNRLSTAFSPVGLFSYGKNVDPYGEILTEIKSFENEISMGTLIPEKLKLSGGYRYRNARRPELFRDIIGREHNSETKPIWLTEKESGPDK